MTSERRIPTTTPVSQASEGIIIIESRGRRRDDEATLRDDTLRDIDREDGDGDEEHE